MDDLTAYGFVPDRVAALAEQFPKLEDVIGEKPKPGDAVTRRPETARAEWLKRNRAIWRVSDEADADRLIAEYEERRTKRALTEYAAIRGLLARSGVPAVSG